MHGRHVVRDMSMRVTPRDLGLPARFTEYRDGQMELARAIGNSLCGGTRHALLSAPTGTGKGLIAMTAARLMGARRVLVLVASRALQTQWLRDWYVAGMVEVKGQQNYRCKLRASSCEDGETCPARRAPRDEGIEPLRMAVYASRQSQGLAADYPGARCPYMVARDTACGAELVVSNYAYWLALGRQGTGPALGDFDLIVCDEAHGASDAVADFMAIELRTDLVHAALGVDVPDSDDVEELALWARIAYNDGPWNYKQEARSTDKWVRRLTRSLAQLATVSDHANWIVTRDTAHGGTVTVAPIWARAHMERHLYRAAPRVLSMSATLLPRDATYMGLDASAHTYHEAGSTFDAARRPFYTLPTCRVDHRMSEGELRVLVNRMDAYMEPRLALGWKGVVHSIAYRHADAVKRLSRHAARMIVHGRQDAREAVGRFVREREPCVLVSPAVKEGFDFAQDACRWQIIFKVPWADGRDPVNKARSRTDAGYKYHLAARDIVQMAGRNVRSEQDWGETLLLDSAWSDYFARRADAQGSWPAWFKAAWRPVAALPSPLDAASM